VNGSHDRDQSIERLLRQSFKATEVGVTGSCLDAETLSAWIDGGLSGAALEIAQSHVADCARCQALVGAMARIDAIVGQQRPSSRLWLAWLVPLTAAAAAVALWVAVPRGPAAPARQATDIQAPAPEVKASEPGSVTQPRSPQAASAAKEETSGAERDSASSAQAQARELRKDAGRLETDGLKPQAKTAGEIASSASADQAAPAPAAAPQPVAPTARQRFEERSGNTLAETITIAPIMIVSPDPSIRWRLAGSAVEHSTNGGASWAAVATGLTAQLTAGAAPSTTVCWVVGRGGVVLLSTDGRSFSRVAFPEMTDLSAVRASDARSAVVSTMDGRTFTTTNGETWQSSR
jgi:hypothetical protein